MPHCVVDGNLRLREMKPPAQGYLLAPLGPEIHIETYFFLFTILL